MDLYKGLAEKASAVKAQMKICNKDGNKPDDGTFEGFLSGVLDEIDKIVSSRSDFPEKSLLAARAVREWDGQYQNDEEVDKLYSLLEKLDTFINCAKYTKPIKLDLDTSQKGQLAEILLSMLMGENGYFYRHFYNLHWTINEESDDVFMDALLFDTEIPEISQADALSLFNAINSMLHITDASKLEFSLDDIYALTGKLSEQVYAQEYSLDT